MFALVLRAELRFPHCGSLKDKRRFLSRIVDGSRARFGVSVAEVGHQDTWQRAAVGFALVSGEMAVITDQADRLERFIWASEAEVLDLARTWVELD